MVVGYIIFKGRDPINTAFFRSRSVIFQPVLQPIVVGYTMSSWALGSIVGPSLGGLTAEPCSPESLLATTALCRDHSVGALLRRYPFMLAFGGAAVLSMVDAVISAATLHPEEAVLASWPVGNSESEPEEDSTSNLNSDLNMHLNCVNVNADGRDCEVERSAGRGQAALSLQGESGKCVGERGELVEPLLVRSSMHVASEECPAEQVGWWHVRCALQLLYTCTVSARVCISPRNRTCVQFLLYIFWHVTPSQTDQPV